VQLDIVYNEDCLTGLAKLPENSINCCVTSPPYYGLRDYGVDGQIGLEDTPEQYVAKMVDVFREVRRVLKPEGTLWLNLGDSYAGSGKGGRDTENAAKYKQGTNVGAGTGKPCGRFDGIKPKDLMGIPWRVAFALQADGWYLRQDIIWSKPNPMPESVTDRCTKAHEYIFLLSKNSSYFYDYKAIKEQGRQASIDRYKYAFSGRDGLIMPDGKPQQIAPKGMRNATTRKGIKYNGQTVQGKELRREQGLPELEYMVRNKRSVWTVTTHPYGEAHFATFPEKLIEPCILAGCPKDGVVLDPFMGSGTTGRVAVKFNRHYIGFEINPEYIKLCDKRVDKVQMRMI
jgi:DNA modification methylase